MKWLVRGLAAGALVLLVGLCLVLGLKDRWLKRYTESQIRLATGCEATIQSAEFDWTDSSIVLQGVQVFYPGTEDRDLLAHAPHIYLQIDLKALASNHLHFPFAEIDLDQIVLKPGERHNSGRISLPLLGEPSTTNEAPSTRARTFHFSGIDRLELSVNEITIPENGTGAPQSYSLQIKQDRHTNIVSLRQFSDVLLTYLLQHGITVPEQSQF